MITSRKFSFVPNNKVKFLLENLKKIPGVKAIRIPQPEDKLNYTLVISTLNIIEFPLSRIKLLDVKY